MIAKVRAIPRRPAVDAFEATAAAKDFPGVLEHRAVYQVGPWAMDGLRMVFEWRDRSDTRSGWREVRNDRTRAALTYATERRLPIDSQAKFEGPTEAAAAAALMPIRFEAPLRLAPDPTIVWCHLTGIERVLLRAVVATRHDGLLMTEPRRLAILRALAMRQHPLVYRDDESGYFFAHEIGVHAVEAGDREAPLAVGGAS